MNDLESLKQYISDQMIWIPVWTAFFSMLSAWGAVCINNYFQRKWKEKVDLRQERKQAYIAYFVVQWMSFIRPNVKRGTALSYQEMCDQFKTADFSISINSVKLVAPESICDLCDRLDDVVNGKIIVSREEFIALLLQIGDSMTSNIRNCS